MAEKKGFMLYHNNEKQFSMLSDEQAGILIKALFRYSITGKPPALSETILEMAFSFLSDCIDRDAERYDEICRRNSENGKKGGRPRKNSSEETRKTEGFLKKPRKANYNVNDNEKNNYNDNDNFNDNDNATDRSASDTQTHTSCSEDSLFSKITAIVQKLGCQWTEQEIREFIAYNLDAGRHLKDKPNWAWAVRKWEENRCKRLQQFPSCNASGGGDDTADPYLAVSQKWMENMD